MDCWHWKVVDQVCDIFAKKRYLIGSWLIFMVQGDAHVLCVVFKRTFVFRFQLFSWNFLAACSLVAVSPLPTQVMEPHRMPQIQDVCACKDSSSLRQRLDSSSSGSVRTKFLADFGSAFCGLERMPWSSELLLSAENIHLQPWSLILTPHCSWEEGRSFWGASAQVQRTCISAVYIPMVWFGLHAHWWPNCQSVSQRERRETGIGEITNAKNKEETSSVQQLASPCTFGLQETRFGICSLLWGEWLFLWVIGLDSNNLYFSTSDSAKSCPPSSLTCFQ